MRKVIYNHQDTVQLRTKVLVSTRLEHEVLTIFAMALALTMYAPPIREH